VETNALYFGDNLKVLSERHQDGGYKFPSESVDLVYLDPPFNSNRNYNLIFKESSGTESEAQIKAFEDTWHWDSVARDTLAWITVDAVNEGRIPDRVARLMDALVRGIGHNDMSAYLVMMAPRLVELQRVLKPTGSLYLHCDPTASHHLKVVLDAIFGPQHFVNEISWKRSDAHNDYGQGAKHLGRIHDVILFYRKSDKATFNPLYTPLPQTTIDKWYRHVEPETGRRYNLADITGPGGASKGNPHYEFLGVTRYWRYSQERMQKMYDEGRIVQAKPGAVPAQKRYLDESKGVGLQDMWTDIDMLRGLQKGERLGWMTQKPVALLERIIELSSNPGDIVLDPFCGCGTALIAAEKLKRRWIGIDVTHLSIAVMKARLLDSFGLKDVPVFGVPADLDSARMLAKESTDGRYEFQWWALSLIDAKPLGAERKKGADRGIDGVITFSERDSIQRILVSVKSGKPSLLHAKELLATLETEGGAVGILIELEEPTTEMRRAATEAGSYESELWGGRYDKLQIVTIAELLDGQRPNVPKFLPGYQKATRIAAELGEQQELFGGSS
jgi:DNA modification methylase